MVHALYYSHQIPESIEAESVYDAKNALEYLSDENKGLPVAILENGVLCPVNSSMSNDLQESLTRAERCAQKLGLKYESVGEPIELD